MDTTEKKMAAAILRFEDSRVTGPDSLRVSRLPAADKGGKWEICGICDGIEPAVFNRLKALLDAGRREEAWEGCLQYVLDNTAAVRSWLGSDAYPGVEFILRDPGKQTRQMLQTVLAQTGESEFLSTLNERRKSFYHSCKQFPVFGKGWLNRSNEAYRFAQSLI